MGWFQALLLGIIQGLTEFLPISSSGHLIIGKELLGLGVTDNIAFETAVHCATVLSTITILHKEIEQLFLKLFKLEWNEETKYICMLLFSMIPVLLVGVFLKKTVENLFGEGLVLVGIMLIVTALLLLLSSITHRKQKAESRRQKIKISNIKSRSKPITWENSFLIGLAQAVAVLPGLSRSGVTIAIGLLAGVKKEEIAKFSFLMVLIPILGETALDGMNGTFSAAVSGIPTNSLLIGFLAAYLSGCFACKFMIELLKRTKLIWFAIYCSIVGIVAILYILC